MIKETSLFNIRCETIDYVCDVLISFHNKAVDRGELPHEVLKDILANVKSTDRKATVMTKVRNGES